MWQENRQIRIYIGYTALTTTTEILTISIPGLHMKDHGRFISVSNITMPPGHGVRYWKDIDGKRNRHRIVILKLRHQPEEIYQSV